MGYRSFRVYIAVIGALSLTALLASASSASAVNLNGDWAPFNRCPVDDPTMLAADGVNTVDLCTASNSPSGSIKLGKTTATTGNSNLQFGLISTGEGQGPITPPGGAIVADPAVVPGGLIGMLGENLLKLLLGSVPEINKVTATVEPAGPLTDFNLAAGLGVGEPIVTVPVKIHLRNPVLGKQCYIGSDANPIVLHPSNTTLGTARVERFDPDGTPNPTDGVMLLIEIAGSTQGDSTFSVPKAKGCGLLGLLNGAINQRTGLPSPSGNNNLVLNDATTSIAGFNTPSDFAPNSGHALSDAWHSAVLP